MEFTKNDLIAQFMGFEKVTVGYFGDQENEEWGETDWQVKNSAWLDYIGLTAVGEYYVNVLENKYFDTYTYKYTEWNNLIPVIEKIEDMNFKTEMLKTFNDSMLGNYHRFFISKNTHEHGHIWFSSESNNKMESIYETIIKFINWYNENGN